MPHFAGCHHIFTCLVPLRKVTFFFFLWIFFIHIHMQWLHWTKSKEKEDCVAPIFQIVER